VVPRSAFHNGRLYVVSADSRLDIRPVTTGLVQGDLAAIDRGIEPGERIVVSDLIPAVAGMLLAPQSDDELLARLKAEAAGGTPRP
jgi:hypothetical protein